MSRIVRLQAEGFKRLVAVDITPDPHLNRIGGNNEEGKSSLLDSIFAAIGGAEALPVKPVRTGEEYAIVRVDMGELKATRFFDKDGTTSLKLENADGANYGAAQTKLDELVGAITFDPLAFANMSPKDQAAELRRLVKLDVDLDDLAAKDKADFAARRDINRDALAVKARVEAIVLPTEIPETAPDKDALVEALTNAADTNNAITVEERRRSDEADDITALADSSSRNLDRAAELRRQADEAEQEGKNQAALATARREALDALPPLAERVDTSALRVQIQEAETALALIARRDERKRLAGEFAALKARSDALSAAMAARKDAREKALASAQMPIEGLGLDTVGDDFVVTFNGEPFSQSSGAQRIKVSTALAIAANPKLRVCVIKDGSLLDSKNLATLAEMAREHDFQIWLETVGEEGAGIIMEAGAVKGAAEPERVQPPKRRKKAEGDVVPMNPDDTAGSTEPPTSSIEEVKVAPPARRQPRALGEIVTKPADRLL